MVGEIRGGERIVALYVQHAGVARLHGQVFALELRDDDLFAVRLCTANVFITTGSPS